MGRIAKFLSWTLAKASTAPPDVKGDPGGGAIITAGAFCTAGDDSRPIDGDFFVTVTGPGTGEEVAVAFQDPKRPNKAGAGERYLYSRISAGKVAAAIHLKANGDIEIQSLEGSGVIKLNGVEIDQDGNITATSLDASGDVTVGGDVSSPTVTLNGHEHATAATGPAVSPTPGT